MHFNGKTYETAKKITLLTVNLKIKRRRIKDGRDKNMDITNEFMFIHMPAKAGIKKFGQKATLAKLKYFNQLDKGAVPGTPVLIPVNTRSLKTEEKRKALPVVNLIKEKRDGGIKGCT